MEERPPAQVHGRAADAAHLPVDDRLALEVLPDHVPDSGVTPTDTFGWVFRQVGEQPLDCMLADGGRTAARLGAEHGYRMTDAAFELAVAGEFESQLLQSVLAP